MPEAEILIENNGKIAYVGNRDDADIPSDATWVDSPVRAYAYACIY